MKDFCVFRVGQKVYSYKVMPFDLASAPSDCSFAVKRVVAISRSRGFRASIYIDNRISSRGRGSGAVDVGSGAGDLMKARDENGM